MNQLPSTLFMFRSGANATIHGFTAERTGKTLPEKLGPWTSIGIVRGDQRPPYGLKRQAIENGIAEAGFQLWRKGPRP